MYDLSTQHRIWFQQKALSLAQTSAGEQAYLNHFPNTFQPCELLSLCYFASVRTLK